MLQLAMTADVRALEMERMKQNLCDWGFGSLVQIFEGIY